MLNLLICLRQCSASSLLCQLVSKPCLFLGVFWLAVTTKELFPLGLANLFSTH
jgi:hypothetical protein